MRAGMLTFFQGHLMCPAFLWTCFSPRDKAIISSFLIPANSHSPNTSLFLHLLYFCCFHSLSVSHSTYPSGGETIWLNHSHPIWSTLIEWMKWPHKLWVKTRALESNGQKGPGFKPQQLHLLACDFGAVTKPLWWCGLVMRHTCLKLGDCGEFFASCQGISVTMCKLLLRCIW